MRDQAEEVRAYAQGLLGSAASEPEALADIRGNLGRVYAGTVEGKVVTWDVVLVATGSDGGGLSFEQVALRACVRFRGQLGKNVDKRWTPIDCGPEADKLRDFGPYDSTIRLSPE